MPFVSDVVAYGQWKQILELINVINLTIVICAFLYGEFINLYSD